MSGHNSAGLLRSFVERISRLEEERKTLAEDIKDIKTEAKSQGFDVKVLRQMVREHMMDESDRAAQREFEDLCEVYRASLGMLGGTPLGDSARKRMAEPPPSSDGEKGASKEDDEQGGEETTPAEFPAEDLDDARQRGRDDAAGGKKILHNPYTAGDPRRAAWDEGFCEASGSDGMDLPAAWRRKPKAPKPSKGEGAP